MGGNACVLWFRKGETEEINTGIERTQPKKQKHIETRRAFKAEPPV